MTLHNIKQWLLPVFFGLCFPLLALAQEISSLSPSALPYGAYVTGLYHIEADDGNGLYLEEQPNGALVAGNLDTTASGFYFWLVENVYTDTFQLYSATQQGQLLAIDGNGTGQWTTDTEAETAQLLFRMYPQGPQRTAANQGVVAIGYITTTALTANYGNADCQCNILTSGANSRFRMHDSGIQGENYRPVAFEKTNNANVLGTVETDTQNNVTRISQELTNFGLPQNFVSSNFFVKGFGEDDLRITIDSTTNGYIGFLDYTHHHFTKEVYRAARPKIGLKIVNGEISLVYLFGEQPLPFGQNLPGREVEVANFVPGVPFTLGFKGQDSLVVSQNGLTYALERAAPAELFFNRSVTQNARMLVQLVQGEVELAYTTKNYLINSQDDLGTDDGSDFVSTHAFLPYNGGDPLINTFDWQQTKWPVRYKSITGVTESEVFSPFYFDDPRAEFSGIKAKFDSIGQYIGGEDFAAVEGWELIKANLGYNADGSPWDETHAPDYPYVIFYDRVAGTLRVFVYTNNQGETNNLTLSLWANGGQPPGNSQGYTPKLWGSLQQFASLDQVEKSAYSKTMPFFGSNSSTWYFADFVMEYDPCIAFFESFLTLQVTKLTQGDLSMIGRLEGASIPADTPEYNGWKNNRENFLMGVMDNNFGSLENTLGDVTFNQYESFDLLNFKDEVNGVLVGADIAEWEKEAARIEWEATETIAEATIAEGVATMVQGAAQMAGGVPLLETGAAVAEGAATMAAGAAQITSGDAQLDLAYAKKLYYDNIKNKIKHDDQGITMAVPPPRPQVVFGELALKGTLTIETTLLINQPHIATPGGLNSKVGLEWSLNAQGRAKPLYNKPMGKFAMLKQPQFGVGVVQSANAGYKAWLKIKEKPYFAHNDAVPGKIDDMLTISIHVQTLDNEGKVTGSATAEEGYTTLFGAPEGKPLPGAMDISDLVDWDQIDLNIAALGNPDTQEIENQLGSWVKVSYEVWSLTLTNLKARDLSRVFANGDQYYNGQSSFAFTVNDTPSTYQLSQEVKTLAESAFGDYDFSDNANFGNTYHFYHTDYDEVSDNFYTMMNNYCNALETAQNPGAKNAEESQDIKGGEEQDVVEEEPAAEELTIAEPGLTVYPNPAQYQVNFRLLSEQAGKAAITLYDLTGRSLISTTDYLNGRDILQGRINTASLPAGIYILKVKLPDGKSITKKIVKQ